jgi:hypothetical protein
MNCDHKRSLSLALAFALGVACVPAALAETVETTETTTTTQAGTVTQLTPSSSTFIVTSPAAEPAPRTYTYSKKTVFLDPSGNVVSAELTRGQPVTIYYRQEGDTLVVDKVVMSKPSRTVTETTTETRRETR